MLPPNHLNVDIVAILHLVIIGLVRFFSFLIIPLLDIEAKLGDENVDLRGSKITTENIFKGGWLLSPFKEGPYLVTACVVILRCHFVSFLNVHLFRPGTHLIHNVYITLLEIVSELKFALP